MVSQRREPSTRGMHAPTTRAATTAVAVAGVDDEDADDGEVRERDLVEAYVADHALEESLNEVINHVVASRPEDPFAVLSALLHAKATAQRGIFLVQVREVLDGWGLPGVHVRVHTGRGVYEARSPSEVPGRPDRPESFDEFAPSVPLDRQRFHGQGYRLRAERAQLLLTEHLRDMEPLTQAAIDDQLLLLEPELGRNICLATSMAVCLAGAKYAEVPLMDHLAQLYSSCRAGATGTGGEMATTACVPMPLFSLINGGRYASNKLFVQEIFVAPVGASCFADALQVGAELNQSLRQQLEARGVGFGNTGAFGGFAPQLQTVAEVFQVLRAAVDETRARLEGGDAAVTLLEPGTAQDPLRLEFGIHFAASEYVVPSSTSEAVIYNTDKWVAGSTGALKGSDEMLDVIRSCIKELGVTTVVAPFAPADLKSFTALMTVEHDGGGVQQGVMESEPADATYLPANGSPGEIGEEADKEADAGSLAERRRRRLGGDPNCNLQVVVMADMETHHDLEGVHRERAANTVLYQLHQFPSVSAALTAICEARRLGIAVILGTTVGQSPTESAFLAALAIALGIGQVKFGGLGSADCVEHYNQLAMVASGDGATNVPGFVATAYRR